MRTDLSPARVSGNAPLPLHRSSLMSIWRALIPGRVTKNKAQDGRIASANWTYEPKYGDGCTHPVAGGRQLALKPIMDEPIVKLDAQVFKQRREPEPGGLPTTQQDLPPTIIHPYGTNQRTAARTVLYSTAASFLGVIRLR
jgi:hypothetical protein